jgi:NhaA family Na+:H+ antiporter
MTVDDTTTDATSPPSGDPAIERVLGPLRAFMDGSASGGILLIAMTALAIAWANSPWADSYDSLWQTPLGVSLGDLRIEHDLHFWVNDALMAMFFLVIGLEIKREVLIGELGSVARAALPAAAAVGGALLPAALFVLAVGVGSPAIRGWGVPMATDIAFALGVLALMGRRAPTGLRVFLTALAIVDDLLAVVVIALFYTSAVDTVALACTGGTLALLLVLNRAGVRHLWAYAILGVVLWLAVLQSGIHPTIAGVLLALAIPARTRFDAPTYVAAATQHLRELTARLAAGAGPEERHDVLWELEDTTRGAQAPMLRQEHLLQGWVAFLVVPLFALANAGIRIPPDPLGALSQPIVLGIVIGLVVGKQAGIVVAAQLVTRRGLGRLPGDVAWRQLYGAAWLGGIGFTMSLFVAELAFPEGPLLESAKLGILAASVIAAIGGTVVLLVAQRGGPVAGAASDVAA